LCDTYNFSHTEYIVNTDEIFLAILKCLITFFIQQNLMFLEEMEILLDYLKLGLGDPL